MSPSLRTGFSNALIADFLRWRGGLFSLHKICLGHLSAPWETRGLGVAIG